MYYLLVYLRRSCFLKDFIREIGLLMVWRHPDLPLQWFKEKINVEGLRACKARPRAPMLGVGLYSCDFLFHWLGQQAKQESLKEHLGHNVV